MRNSDCKDCEDDDLDNKLWIPMDSFCHDTEEDWTEPLTEPETQAEPSKTTKGLLLLKSCATLMLDPNHRPFRYVIAILVAFVEAALTYVVELPAGLEATIIRVMKINNAQYSIIFSAYSWPDIVMAFIGSVIANKYLGIHKGFVIFMTIVMLGQLLCAVGCYLGSFWILLSGRLIIGCGYGATISLVNTFQVIWFAGKEIAFVMSLARIMCRIGATLALFTPQITYDGLSNVVQSSFTRLGYTQMVGTLICIIGVVFTLIVGGLDKYGTKIIIGRKRNSASINILNVLNFNHSFWIVVTAVATFYGVVYIFTANSPLYFVSKYGFSLYLANLANSLSYSSVIFASPFISLTIDYVGYHLVWAYAGLLIAISPCLLYLFSGNDYAIPFIAAFLISLSYSVFGSTGWTIVSLAVKPHQITTAYGIAMSLLALVVSLNGILSGVVIDNFGYSLMISFNFMVLFLMSNLILYLYFEEFFSDKKVLNKRGGLAIKSKHSKKV